jgi:hypothetical protein
VPVTGDGIEFTVAMAEVLQPVPTE